jgi:hypothetical protein
MDAAGRLEVKPLVPQLLDELLDAGQTHSIGSVVDLSPSQSATVASNLAVGSEEQVFAEQAAIHSRKREAFLSHLSHGL